MSQYINNITCSEKDERIRKELIEHCRKQAEMYNTLRSAKEYSEVQSWLNWLENQGKQNPVYITDEWIEDYWQHEKVNNPYSYNNGEEIQFDHQGFVSFCKKYCKKPTDNVELKFNVGDWVVSPNGVYWHIDDIRDDRYQVCSDSGEIADWPLDTNIYHRFTIKDAKDGDVLRIKNLTFIFQEINNNNACHKDAAVAYCSYENNDEAFGACGPDCITDLELITPATKEQRNLLFQKIHEAGYDWYACKKELKEIDQEPTYADGWHDAIDCIQKNTIIPQNNITDEELAQAKKDAYNEALDKIEYHNGEPTFDDGWSAAIWYLKKRNAQPQTTWKPSSEQMHYLYWMANINLGGSVVEQEVSKHLNELYNDLKKLKGE